MFKRCTESSESLVVVSIQGISERIPGTLRFTPNSGIVLSITDVNPDILNTFSLQPIEYEIIHGQFVEGAAFTLINSFVKDTSIGSSNIAVITIVSNGMLNGVHINNLDEPTFEGIDVQLSSLNNWFNIKTIELDITDIHSPTDGKCFSLTCKHAQRIGFSPLEKGPSILSEQYISSNGYGQSSHGELNSIFSILLHPREYFSINSLDHELFRLQGFMSLLCGHQVFINQVKLFTANITDKKEKYLKVSHHLACYSRSLTDEDEKLEKILLTRDVLDDNLPVAWSRWTERYHLYRTPIQLFMATEIFQNQLLDFKFLSIMQALEALHRNIKGGKYLKESEYEKVADILRNAIPLGTQSDLHQSLQSRIRYGNEYSLRRRIKELWNKLPNVIQNELHPKFLSCYGKIIDTRNFFTHYDIDLEPKAYKGLGLIYITKLLRWMCLSVFLVDLGINEDTLAHALKQSDDLVQAKRFLMSSKGSS